MLHRLTLFLLLVISIGGHFCQSKAKTLYDFSAIDIDGNEVSFGKYAGHTLIVVNVASQCGLTDSNYRELNDLYDRYESKGLRIAAFPSNQFNQEPGDSKQIKEFVKSKNVKFDVYAKVDINGENTHPIYKWLKAKLPGILSTEGIKWNFTKFLINCEGIPVQRYGPLHQPKDMEADIIAQIKSCEAKVLNSTVSTTNTSKEL